MKRRKTAANTSKPNPDYVPAKRRVYYFGFPKGRKKTEWVMDPLHDYNGRPVGLDGFSLLLK